MLGLWGFTYAMAPLAWALRDTGRWSELQALLDEIDTVCAVYDLAVLHTESNAVRADLLACSGDSNGAASRIRAGNGGASIAVALIRATGHSAMARGDFEGAYRAFRQIFGSDGELAHFVVSYCGIADLAWAGARSGHVDEVRPVIAAIGRLMTEVGSRSSSNRTNSEAGCSGD